MKMRLAIYTLLFLTASVLTFGPVNTALFIGFALLSSLIIAATLLALSRDH